MAPRQLREWKQKGKSFSCCLPPQSYPMNAFSFLPTCVPHPAPASSPPLFPSTMFNIYWGSWSIKTRAFYRRGNRTHTHTRRLWDPWIQTVETIYSSESLLLSNQTLWWFLLTRENYISWLWLKRAVMVTWDEGANIFRWDEQQSEIFHWTCCKIANELVLHPTG